MVDWRDEGVVLGVRRHGETALILEAMTLAHGRHLGFVHGGRSRRMQPVLQPGNTVALAWRARLDEQLGTYAVEPLASRTAALLESPRALAGVAHLGALLRLLPERDPQPGLYAALPLLLDRLGDGALAPALMVRFELELLRALGFAPDLAACALTGTTVDLAYVSPRSGRAASRLAGAPHAAKLLALPRFLAEPQAGAPPDAAEVAAGRRLTGHFLARDLFTPRGQPLPDARRAFFDAATRRTNTELAAPPGAG